MALRLGERFNRNFGTNIDVAIAAADAVCRTSQSEFGASYSTRDNPVVSDPNWKGVTTDMYSQFRNEGRSLYVMNYVSGQRNFFLNWIRGLSDDRRAPQPASFTGGGWYNQQWMTLSHTGADDWATFYNGNSPFKFYADARTWFNGSCNNPCPHGGMYDSVHCFVGKAPRGTSPFIWSATSKNYYYTPIGFNTCPRTGSSFDGANCKVGDAPDHLDPFIWNGGWYYHPDWSKAATCNDYWTAWYDRDNSSGTGDWEEISLALPTPCGGNTPVDVNCQTTTGIDAWLTGENLFCSASSGLVCKNSDQLDGYCNWDYKVRYRCP